MESETDTEEYEKVSQTPSDMQNVIENKAKVHSSEFGTCTDEIETKNSETMTEVRINIHHHNIISFTLSLNVTHNRIGYQLSMSISMWASLIHINFY